MIWLCSLIQYEKIIKMGGNKDPTEVFFSAEGRGLAALGVWLQQEGLPRPQALALPGRAAAAGPAEPVGDLGAKRGSQGVGTQQDAGREAGAGVECLYRDPRATSFSFASLSDHGKTPFDLLLDILALNS